MSLKDEFEKAFNEDNTVVGGLYTVTSYESALWAAQWMAERCAKKVAESPVGSDMWDLSAMIRKLAKQLGGSDDK